MKLKISFKQHPKPTGLYAVGNPLPFIDIKLDGKVIGFMSPPNWQGYYYSIYITVYKTEPDDNSNCDWFNLRLKGEFSDKNLAKEHVKKILPLVMKKYKIYKRED